MVVVKERATDRINAVSEINGGHCVLSLVTPLIAAWNYIPYAVHTSLAVPSGVNQLRGKHKWSTPCRSMTYHPSAWDVKKSTQTEMTW